MKPKYTCSTILALPPKHQSSEYITPDIETRGVDFLRMNESDALDIAYTLSCTKKGLIYKPCGSKLERLENILKRKFHLATNPFSNQKKSELEISILDVFVCGVLYIHPHNSKKEVLPNIEFDAGWNGGLKSCLKPQNLSIGPKWFQLLQMIKDPNHPRRNKIYDQILHAILHTNKPKRGDFIETDNCKFILKRIEVKESVLNTIEIKDRLLNSIDYNISSVESKSIHTRTSTVSFHWKVQQRRIPNQLVYSVGRLTSPLTFPIPDTLLKIDTSDKNVYILPSFMESSSLFKDIFHSIRIKESVFLQPPNLLESGDEQLLQKKDNTPDKHLYAADITSSSFSSQTKYCQSECAHYQDPLFLSIDYDIFCPVSIMTDYVAEKGKIILEKGESFIETIYLLGRLSSAF